LLSEWHADVPREIQQEYSAKRHKKKLKRETQKRRHRSHQKTIINLSTFSVVASPTAWFASAVTKFSIVFNEVDTSPDTKVLDAGDVKVLISTEVF
jgi:hypothetical protein